MAVNGRAKGAAGERQFCEWLYETFELPEKPKRNLEQVREGGADVICQPFAFEVKRCQNVDKYKFWMQVKRAVAGEGSAMGLEPVVAFRVNRQPWNFLICARHIGLDKGYIQLEERHFVNWANNFIQQYNIDMLEKQQTTKFVDQQLDRLGNERN